MDITYNHSIQKQYSFPITNPIQGESAIYRSNPYQNLVQKKYEDVDTMQKWNLKTFKEFPNKNALGTYNSESNQYEFITYKELEQKSMAIGSVLSKSKYIEEIIDSQGIKIYPVGIYSQNRAEWTLVDIACQLYGLTSVTFYDTLGPQSNSYIIKLVNLQIIFCSAQTIKNLLNLKVTQLKQIICFDQLDNSIVQSLNDNGIEVSYLNEMISFGEKQLQEIPIVLPSTIYTLCFTSGTTGEPKGVVHPHSTFVAQAASYAMQNKISMNSDDIHLSYLPLPHLFERAIISCAISSGVAICYTSGNLLQDLSISRPTFFISVPRFYEQIKNSINQMQEIQRQQTEEAIQIKLDQFHLNGETVNHELDGKFFSKFKMILGGRQRYCITGSAPISGQVLDFLKVTLCCPIIEGYGQTESTASSFLTHYDDNQSGYVGGPTQMNEFKLVDVIEMGYLTTDLNQYGKLQPRGEICIRGPAVIVGYFNEPDKTNSTIDSNGWLHTGDIGMILPNGALQIIDRKKNIFKLSQGEYICPEKIQNVNLRCKGILDNFVYGDSLKSYCVIIVVPEPVFLKKLGEQIGLGEGHEKLCRNIQIRKIILENLKQHGKQEQLNSLEITKNIYLEDKSFLQIGILTETQKMQRHKAIKYYREVFESLYEEGPII